MNIMNIMNIIVLLQSDVSSSTILQEIIQSGQLNESFPYRIGMSNDKYIDGIVTIFHLSILFNRLDVTRYLLNNGSLIVPIYINDGNSTPITPILNGMELYLDNLENYNEDGGYEEDFRFLASLYDQTLLTHTLYNDSLQFFNYRIISILLEFGANPNDYRAINMIKQDDILYTIFCSHGFDINSQNHQGKTFLHLSIEYGADEDVIEWLLSNGADKTIREANQQTPYDYLTHIIYNGNGNNDDEENGDYVDHRFQMLML